MKKRGQISVFIILGIIILSVIAALFFLRQSKVASAVEEIPLTINTEPVELFVEQCLRSTAEEAIQKNGLSGGYFILPVSSTNSLFSNVPYYFDLGQNRFPQDALLAEQIGKYVDALLDFCLNDFRLFTEKGYVIKAEPPKTTALIKSHKITLTTTLPLTITLGVQQRELSTFRVELEGSQLYDDLQLAREIVASQENEDICLTCFTPQATEQQVFVGILPITQDTYLYELTDDDYRIGNEPYQLRFAVKFHAAD